MGATALAVNDMEPLRIRFETLWQRHAYTDCTNTPGQVFQQLVDMYSQDWRSYHNMIHISSSLDYLDACKSQAEFADAIEFAIWFHDCIFEVGAADNEARSRDWFVSQAKTHLPPALISAVDELIMDTCHHCVPKSEDGKLIADIDLTSFALPWDEYLRDSMAVRGELPNLDESKALTEKARFLDNLIKDDQIYYSRFYLENFERKAQQNVRKHMDLLVAGQPGINSYGASND